MNRAHQQYLERRLKEYKKKLEKEELTNEELGILLQKRRAAYLSDSALVTQAMESFKRFFN